MYFVKQLIEYQRFTPPPLIHALQQIIFCQNLGILPKM